MLTVQDVNLGILNPLIIRTLSAAATVPKRMRLGALVPVATLGS